ncbi:MAG: transposase [Alphaproteobacteria bacterium]
MQARKDNRLQNFDYSTKGAYFVTICTKDRKKLLWKKNVGAVIDRPQITPHPQLNFIQINKENLSKYGLIVDKAINQIDVIYENLASVEKYVIMPNHIHLIIRLQPPLDNAVCGQDAVCGRSMTAPTISRIIKQLKFYVTKQIDFSIWQKLFHYHIIRNDEEYKEIYKYIDENPTYWCNDCYYE